MREQKSISIVIRSFCWSGIQIHFGAEIWFEISTTSVPHGVIVVEVVISKFI